MITIGLKDPTGKPLGYPRIEEEKEMEIPLTIAAVTDEDITRFAEIRFNSLFNPIDEQSKSWLFTKFEQLNEENRALRAVKDGLIVGLLTIKKRIDQISRGGSLRF